jgi:hypothetical protein
VDSPDPLEVRRGERVERQRKIAAGEGRGSQRYVQYEHERDWREGGREKGRE